MSSIMKSIPVTKSAQQLRYEALESYRNVMPGERSLLVTPAATQYVSLIAVRSAVDREHFAKLDRIKRLPGDFSYGTSLVRWGEADGSDTEFGFDHHMLALMAYGLGKNLPFDELPTDTVTSLRDQSLELITDCLQKGLEHLTGQPVPVNYH